MLCDKVQVLLILAGSEVFNGEVVVRQRAQGVTLAEHSIDLTESADMSLIDSFDGIVFFLADSVENFSEGSLPERFLLLELISCVAFM